MGTRIPFTRPDGKTAEGYLSLAGKANVPGVVVIQEWWGLQDQIKGLCDRFALAGYDALAPDLFNGVVVPYHDAEAASREMNSLNFLEAADQHVRGAAQFLLRSSPKVAVSGFCMGGAVACLRLVARRNFPPLFLLWPAAGNGCEARRRESAVQGHFANSDDYVTPERVDAFEKGLKAAGKTAEIYRYDASHAFMNEQRSVHDRHCAELAWERVGAFLKTHLG